MTRPSTKVFTLALSLSLSGALLAACGGAAAPAESAEPATDGAAPASDTPAEEAKVKSFDEMTAPERMQHMKTVVAPHMAKVFQEADAEKYAKFGCSGCHGPGAKEGNFEMPNAALPPLNKEEMDAHPEATKFMAERVVPEMAKLLGEEPYNPETHEGFGCFDCHTKKE